MHLLMMGYHNFGKLLVYTTRPNFLLVGAASKTIAITLLLTPFDSDALFNVCGRFIQGKKSRLHKLHLILSILASCISKSTDVYTRLPIMDIHKVVHSDSCHGPLHGIYPSPNMKSYHTGGVSDNMKIAAYILFRPVAIVYTTTL